MIFGMLMVFVAGLFQGLTSFGFALISMPFFLAAMSIGEAVPTVVILGLCTNAMVIAAGRKGVDMREVLLLVAGSALCTPLGVYALRHLNPDILKLATGALLISVSLLLLLGISFPIKNARLGYLIAGALSGFLNSSIAMSGPPVALLLSNQGTPKEAYRANIALYGIILNAFTIILYLQGRMLTTALLGRSLGFIPATILGVLLGIAASKRLDERVFRIVSLVLISVSGAWTLVAAILQIARR